MSPKYSDYYFYICDVKKQLKLDMAKFGYMMRFANYDTAEADFNWMADFGCEDVVEEQPEMEKLRPAWKSLLSGLEHGDTLVVPKLSNVLRGSMQLSVFLEICRIKSLRLISIHDRIDTGGEYFTDIRITDVLEMIATLPKEVYAARKSSGRKIRINGHIAMQSEASQRRAERIKVVISMYKKHCSLPEIMKASGFKSRGSIFRVLNEAGVKLNRSNRDYYAGKNDKKEDENTNR